MTPAVREAASAAVESPPSVERLKRRRRRGEAEVGDVEQVGVAVAEVGVGSAALMEVGGGDAAEDGGVEEVGVGVDEAEAPSGADAVAGEEENGGAAVKESREGRRWWMR